MQTATDARGYQTQYTDNPGAKTLTVTNALNTPRQRTQVSTVDALGSLVQQTNGLGQSVVQVGYNSLEQVLSLQDGLGHGPTFTLGANGAASKITDALGQATVLQNDILDRAIQVTDPNTNSTQAVYNPVDQVVQSTDGLGHLTRTIFDLLGQPIYTIDANGGLLAQQFDGNGNRLSLTDPDGNTTRWRYNFHNLVTQATDPSGHATAYTYDVNGRLATVTDRDGRTIQYNYLANGWLQWAVWKDAGGSNVNTRSYTYDASGHLTGATDNKGAYSWTYDELGRVASQTDPNNLTLNYTYDLADRLTGVNDSLGGQQTYTYDGASKMTATTFSAGTVSLTENLTYNANNQLTQVQRLSGSQVVGLSLFSYDVGGRLTSITHQDASSHTLDSFAYQFNAANQVTQETSLLGPTRNYTYDALGQLTGDGSSSFQYDPNGNPTGGGNVVGAGNQLQSDGTYNYSYDGEGNLTQKVSISTGEVWKYSYDTENHLTQVTHQANATAAVDLEDDFKYDVLNNRMEKDVIQGGTTTVTKFAYDRGNAWADLNGSGTLLGRHLYLNALDSLFARVGTDGSVAFYLQDRLNSVRDLTDGTGVLRDHTDYDSFGKITTETTPSFGDRYKYTSREWDAEIRLQYNRARDYDPFARRWIGQDPSGFGAGDSNLYRYGNNQPTGANDPTGLSSSWVWFWQEGADWSDWRIGQAMADILGQPAPTSIPTTMGLDGHVYTGNPVPAATESEVVQTIGQDLARLPGSIGGNLQELKEAQEDTYRWQAQHAREDPWGTLVNELFSSFAPGISEVRSVYEAITGHEAIDGRELSVGERVFAGVLVAIPLGGPLIRRGVRWLFGGGQRAAPAVSRVSHFAAEAAAHAPTTGARNPLALPEGYIGPERQLPYRGPILGGSYRDVRAANVGGDIHHMPADSVSPLSRELGPAIHMPTPEHAQTASFGGSRAARAYRQQQQQLIQQGRFMDAVQMDINDLRNLFGNRYDEHIRQMLEWIRQSRTVPGQ